MTIDRTLNGELIMENITVSVADAKKQFSDFVNRSSLGGCRVIITKRNRPVAALVSLKDLQEIEQGEKRRGLLAVIRKWEGFEEVEEAIEAAIEARHAEGTGRDASL
jgi:prevent-host-death family protein